MRILHFIPQFPYFGGRTVVGGHATSLANLALAQAAAGDEPMIVSCLPKRVGEVMLADTVPVHSLFERKRAGTVRFGLRLRGAVSSWAREQRGRFDVIHGHSGFADYLMVTAALKSRLALPTVHTMYCPIPGQGGRWRLPVVHGMLRRWAGRLDALAAMSRNVADTMRDYGLGDVEIVAPPVDIERFRPADDVRAARRELGLGQDDVAVLFVGNATPQKNLSGVFKAFHAVREKHPTARLVITTELPQSSPDHRLAELRQEAVDLDLESCIVQKGIVDDMPGLMQACDLLVAPFRDTFGPSDYFVAALEAMACGKPVVVSDTGGMPEVVTDTRGCLIDPADHGQIAQAINAFLSDPERRRAAGAEARTYTERTFDPALIAARYRETYTRIAS